jgi:hypothetical protein
MKLICTKAVASGQWSVASRKCQRGNAEIELLLVIPLLLTILFLIGGTLSLGKARLTNAYNAENDAYTQTVSGIGFAPSNDPVPPDGINAVRPALPNRYVLADELRNVTINELDASPTFRLNTRAILLDPAWHYSAWPQSADRPAIQDWFDAYVAESHPPVVVNALGLQPAWPP